MTPVFDHDKLQGRRLAARQEFAIPKYELDHALHLLREKMARQLSRTILEQEDFFLLKIQGEYGTLRADCFVLTEDELASVMRDQFKKGIEHANGFRPDWQQD